MSQSGLKRAILARLAVVWASGLVVASLQPYRLGVRHASTVHFFLHSLAYFSTTLLSLLAARGPRGRLYAPLAVVALGAAIEYSQHIIYRGRFEWRDLGSDACAALLACLLIRSHWIAKHWSRALG